MDIVILGSGVVGQATGRGLMEKGHQVTFLDINVDLVRRLRAEGLEVYVVGREPNKLSADIIMVCISTPPREDTRAVNLDYITEGMKTVGQLLAQQPGWPAVVVRSTVPPGTTEQVLIPLMEQYSRKTSGRDFGVCMNPEFLRTKSSVDDFAHPWATVIGELDERSGDVLEGLYRPFGSKIFRMGLTEAEFLKYVHNLRNATVISFYNEMWMFAKEFGITDPNTVFTATTVTAESVWNAAYGSKAGQPYGGACFPKDTNAFLCFAKAMEYKMPLLAAVIQVNEMMERLAEQGCVPSAQIAGHHWQPSPTLAQIERRKCKNT